MNKKLILVAVLLSVTTTTFAQQEQESQIEEVSIVSKRSQDITKVGKNVKLITTEDLKNYQGQNLNEVLNQVGGFQITGNSNNPMHPKMMSVRGGKSSNVVILLDGVPLRDVSGNDYTVSDLRWLALENIQSIEILNGASSVLYGSNATVSVINITTKQLSKNQIEGLLSARAGSFSTFGQTLNAKGKLNQFTYQVSGFNEKSKGISTAEGDDTFDKDGWEKQNIAANFGYTKDRFKINLNTSWNHNLYQYDEGAFADGKYRGDDEQMIIGGHTSYQYNKGNVVLNARYVHLERLYQNTLGDRYHDQYLYKGDDFFLELYNYYEFNPHINLTAGFQYEKQSMSYDEVPWGGNSFVEVLGFQETNIANYDVFAKANFNYNGLNLDAGIRMNNHSKYKDHWVYSVNPYYLGNVGPLFYKVGYSFATAFIAPTLYQNFGSMPWILPNFDLQPETNQSHEIDLTIGKKDKSLVFNASIFQRQEKDGFIYNVVDFTTYAGQFLNVDRNKAKGFELGIDYRMNQFFALGGNFSYVEKDKEESMLRLAKQRLNTYVEFNPFSTTKLFLSHQYVGKRNDAYFDGSTYSTVNVVNKAYHVLNLNINQKINSSLETYLTIGNLTNENYVDIIGYKTRPRNFTFGVNYKF